MVYFGIKYTDFCPKYEEKLSQILLEGKDIAKIERMSLLPGF
jgi:hypothetical protein